eukprot:scaffold20565_cov129-Isochrysis_galbana.AAC.1
MAAILSHFASLERSSYFRGVQGRDLGEPSRRLVGEDKGGSLASEAFGTFAGRCAALAPHRPWPAWSPGRPLHDPLRSRFRWKCAPPATVVVEALRQGGRCREWRCGPVARWRSSDADMAVVCGLSRRADVKACAEAEARFPGKVRFLRLRCVAAFLVLGRKEAGSVDLSTTIPRLGVQPPHPSSQNERERGHVRRKVIMSD